jgi:cytochrome b561
MRDIPDGIFAAGNPCRVIRDAPEFRIGNKRSALNSNGIAKGRRLESHSRTRYSPLAQTFHWVIAILVLAAFIYGPGGTEERVYSAARDFDRQLHETLGMCVFVLSAMRLLWRMVDTHPDPPQVARWMGIAAKAVQWTLYLLLFAVPLTAIAGAWLEGHPVTLLAGVEIAPLLGLSHDTGAKIATIHTWLGDAILWLAGFHALVALFHQFVLRDGVLASMLPRLNGKESFAKQAKATGARLD